MLNFDFTLKEIFKKQMKLYINTKAKVHSPDGETNFFVLDTEVLQGNKLIPYQFIICLDYVSQTSIDLIRGNGLTQKRQEADDNHCPVARGCRIHRLLLCKTPSPTSLLDMTLNNLMMRFQ